MQPNFVSFVLLSVSLLFFSEDSYHPLRWRHGDSEQNPPSGA